MSARIMRILEQHCPQVEQYSIDEAFVRLDGALAAQAAEVVRQLRERVVRWTGISVSVGVARTRTLAKLANHLGKKRADGLAFLGSAADFALEAEDAPLLFRTDDVLAQLPVAEVWGIGRRQARTLWAAGITTAAALRDADDQWLRRALTVTGWRTALELRGLPCIAVENAPSAAPYAGVLPFLCPSGNGACRPAGGRRLLHGTRGGAAAPGRAGRRGHRPSISARPGTPGRASPAMRRTSPCPCRTPRPTRCPCCGPPVPDWNSFSVRDLPTPRRASCSTGWKRRTDGRAVS